MPFNSLWQPQIASIFFSLAVTKNYPQIMFPNLLEATKEYWHKLDQLEAAYQQGKISLEEVDTRVAVLMTELAKERRTALTYFWHGWQHWLTTQRETLIGLALLALVTYSWMLTAPIS